MKFRQKLARHALAVLVVVSAPAFAQQLKQPTYTLVEASKKVFGRASHDFRNIGVIDYWWIGHDPAEGPWKGIEGARGKYAKTQPFILPDTALDGTNMDRHGCVFVHLNADQKIDMVCTLGADKGTGGGPNEVYRNDSTSTAIRMTRMEGAMLPTGIEDYTGRGREMTPFRFADGTQGIFSVVHGEPRSDGQANHNKVFRYNGAGSFKFTEVVTPAINVTTLSTCGAAGDLDGDGLDDLVLCRTESTRDTAAGSLLFMQTPEGTFVEKALPMPSRQFLAAEIADLNGDGRADLVVSVVDDRGPAVEIYRQARDGKLPAEPWLRVPTVGYSRSLAIGDLDGDNKPDIYVALADHLVCKEAGPRNIKDRWPDLVMSTRGAGDQPYQLTSMVDEPTAKGCSSMATWAEPGIIHLGRGLEGVPGDNYSLKFKR